MLDQMRHDIDIELTGPEQVSGRKTTVSFKLSYTGAEGDTVAEVTNALAKFYVSQNARFDRWKHAATEFLKAQLDATEEEDGARRRRDARLHEPASRRAAVSRSR